MSSDTHIDTRPSTSAHDAKEEVSRPGRAVWQDELRLYGWDVWLDVVLLYHIVCDDEGVNERASSGQVSRGSQRRARRVGRSLIVARQEVLPSHSPSESGLNGGGRHGGGGR